MEFLLQLEQKQKYAAWKAVDIRKALKEGRKPTPGPPAGDNDMSIPSNAPSNTYVWFETQPSPVLCLSSVIEISIIAYETSKLYG